MKIFLSQPMTGRTNEQIRLERQELVDYYTSIGHEVIDTVFNFGDVDTKHIGVYYMGYSIVAMADADLVVFMDGWQNSRGCRLELELAKQYEVPFVFASQLG